MSICKDLVNVIKSSNNKETKPYDTQATVVRIEGGTAWVHIPGGAPETPVKKTINAKEGDIVQVRVSGGSAFLLGNASSPPTDDTTALLATEYALTANTAADAAVQSAKTAAEAAADAQHTADSVRGIADEAKEHADEARGYATEAKASAENASEYAARALGNLSTVQSVAETLTWITKHGTMVLTQDTELDPTHVYFVQDNDGDYIVGSTRYKVVTEPKVEDIGTYYELGIDESLNNYVSTHLALTGDGLYVMADDSDWKVLVGEDGVYIIDPNDNNVAKYQQQITLGRDDGSQSAQILDYHSIRLFDKENMSIYSRGGAHAQPYFWVSDLRDDKGRCEINIYKSYPSDSIAVGDTKFLTFEYYAVNSSYDVEVLLVDKDWNPTIPPVPGTDDPVDIKSWFNITKNVVMCDFEANSNYQPTEGKLVWIVIRYISADDDLKVYTLGTRVRTPIDTYYDIKPGGHSFTAGKDLTADGDCSQAFGSACVAKGHYSHAEGRSTSATDFASHSEGSGTRASGNISHAEGSDTEANGASSHAEGQYSVADGDVSHAEGHYTKTEGTASHAEGLRTVAKGKYSHAEGSNNTSTGYASHVEGYNNQAVGYYSHVQNSGNIANYGNQTAIGKFNDNKSANAFEIGNGTADDARSNAFAVDWNGIPYCRNNKNEYGSIFNLIYPVGSIYMSVNNISPATLFGGTWEQIKDRFLLAAGTTYSAGGIGGSADASLPAHTHNLSGTAASNGAHTHTTSGTAASNGAHTHTVSGTAASNGAHTHGMGKIFSSGSGSANAYTMQSNRTQTTRNTASDGAHTHTVSGTAASNGAHTHTVSGTAASNGAHTHTVSGTAESQGVSATGKNMPPYLTVYMWKRTA